MDKMEFLNIDDNTLKIITKAESEIINSCGCDVALIACKAK